MKKLLRKLLGTRAKKSIADTITWFDLKLVKLCATHGRMASVYYLVFSRRFDREHLAVLQGRLSYARSLKKMGQSSPLLRRNVHRLEKGLIMRPRRSVFAESFILETVRCFKAAQVTPGFSESELRWARDVLDQYFGVVGSSPIVEAARTDYEVDGPATRAQALAAEKSFSPYPASLLPDSDITFDELFALFTRRRSTRWYQDKSVPETIIHRAVAAASLAPSACNRQPFRFVVANDRNAATRIAECAGGAAGFADQLPALIVVVGDLSAYPFERDRHLIYVDASLASMQLMLAAETLGLATCPINWPDVDRAETCLQRNLPLPPHERVIMLIAIGFAEASGGIPYSKKKDVGSLIQMLASNDH